ncbi:MAG: hypothetical protein O3A00_24500, partial [Planctomycetota bacterium]|nr:hypothetical protein [Planctomycetota bacterium]
MPEVFSNGVGERIAVRPALDHGNQVLERLDELATKQQAEQILDDISDLRELTQRQFLTLFNAEQRLSESHCPRVFSLRSKSKRKLLASKWDLQIYCEAPGNWHPATEGKQQGQCQINEPAQWMNTLAPWVRRLMTVFKYASHFADPVMGYAAADLNKVVKDDITLMKALIDKLPDVTATEDLKSAHGLAESDRAHRTSDGASLRGLRNLLTELDPQQEWGGLIKTLTPEGHRLWL